MHFDSRARTASFVFSVLLLSGPLHVRDIASFEVSQPAHFAGIKRSAAAHGCQKLGPVHFEVVRVFL